MTGTLEAVIPESSRGVRLDQALAALFPEYSRSRLKAWIDAGHVLLDGRRPRPRDRVAGGERVALTHPERPAATARPQPLTLKVVHEDDALLVIDKPAGLVVHPGAGNPDGTLLNAVLFRAPELANLPRGGIIHRLDKDTSGLLLVARTEAAHAALCQALAARQIEREYLALVAGVMTGGGRVDAPLGRHPVDRLRRAVRADGRPALTHYRVLERFQAHTYLKVRLETGRTHQIRVHLAHIGHPIVGDPVYGRRPTLPRGASSAALAATLSGFRRQALHAGRLAFAHPHDGRRLEFTAAPPEDYRTVLGALRAAAGGAARSA